MADDGRYDVYRPSYRLMETRHLEANGELIAYALSGAWRQEPPALEISAAELKRITPLLLGSGAGPLGWWKVHNSELRDSRAAADLEQTYRYCALQAAVREFELEGLMSLLHAADVDPILIKGWSTSRLYPQKALRPPGDIDLCVPPEQYAKAQKALDSPEGRQYYVDLHAGFGRLDDRSLDDLYARSQVVTAGSAHVRVLGPEDHLRVICVHMLRHGGWRPLWLCDVAVMVETLPADFDWNLCMGRGRRAHWVICAIALAHLLLGAKIEGTPVGERLPDVPRWLVPAVLKQWERPCIAQHTPAELFASHLRHPLGMFKDFGRRWPNPIQASITEKARLNSVPRLPYQLAAFTRQGASFLHRLPGYLREQSR